MGIKKRYKNFVEKFLSKEKGKRFFQFFYSWGASIVIIGALAKLEHWPYNLGTILLTVGLLTEFLVFFVSAFETPPKEYPWERVFPVLDTNDEEDRPVFGGGGNGNSGGGFIGGNGGGAAGSGVAASGGDRAESGGFSGGSGGSGGGGGGTVIVGGGGSTGVVTGEGGSVMPEGGIVGGMSGPIIIGGGGGSGYSGGGGYSGAGSGTSSNSGEGGSADTEAPLTPGQVKQSFGIPSNVNISEEDTNALTASIKKLSGAAEQLAKMSELTDATQQYLDQLSGMADNMQKFSDATGNLANVSDLLLNSYRSITDNSDEITENSKGYLQQMDALNRNIGSLNSIYEVQLHSVSSQMDAVNRINAGLSRIKEMYEGSVVDSTVFRGETEKMTQQIAALNTVYSRLLNAMTMNMQAPMMGSAYNAVPGGYQGGGYNPNPGYNPNYYNPNQGYTPPPVATGNPNQQPGEKDNESNS